MVFEIKFKKDELQWEHGWLLSSKYWSQTYNLLSILLFRLAFSFSLLGTFWTLQMNNLKFQYTTYIITLFIKQPHHSN